MPITNGITAFNSRWSELDKGYPTSNEQSTWIFSLMTRISEGGSIEECLNSVKGMRWFSASFEYLFTELAKAYMQSRLTQT